MYKRQEVVAEAGRYRCQQYFARVDNKRNPSVVVTVRAILLFMEDFDGRIFSTVGGPLPFSIHGQVDDESTGSTHGGRVSVLQLGGSLVLPLSSSAYP